MKYRRYLILGLITGLTAPVAHGSTLFVGAEARTASGRPAGIHAHIVAIDSGTVLPGALRVPGEKGLQPLLVNRSGEAILFVTSGNFGRAPTPGAARPSMVSVFATLPLAPWPGGRWATAPDWRIRSAHLFPDLDSPAEKLALLEEAIGEGVDAAGRVTVLECAPQSGEFFSHVGPTWELPGAPRYASVLRSRAELVVLCADHETRGPFLHVRDFRSGAVKAERIDLVTVEEQFGIEPMWMGSAEQDAMLLILVSGRALDHPTGEAFSWLYVVDAATYEPDGAPLKIPGAVEPGAGGVVGHNDGSLWIATRSPGTEFAYLTQVRPQDTPLEAASHVAFSGVSNALRVAAGPGGALAVGAENRLEIWRDGRPGAEPMTFPARIGAVLWTDEGLFVGEGARIRRIDPDAQRILKTVQLQTGLVRELTPLRRPQAEGTDHDGDGVSYAQEKALGTSPHSADSDEDGIPDGRDPEPTTPSPLLDLPPSVVFRGEWAGAEEHALILDTEHARDWSIEFDKAAMPWLSADSIRQGADRVRLLLSVNPAGYRPVGQIPMGGKVTVRLLGPEKEAVGSPAVIEVRVTPPRERVRRILWALTGPTVDGARQAHDFQALHAILAGPPHFFSHDHLSENAGRLDPAEYALVVLEAAQAARGAVTRQAILDYVRRGGAMLFLGAHEDALSSASLARWLDPLGIQIDVDAIVQGVYDKSLPHPITKAWNRLDIRDGALVRADENVTILVPRAPENREAILSLRSYGLGHIVVLASGSPFKNGALARPAYRQFAEDLFQWLAQAGKNVLDHDGDRLPDGLEDRNRNGRLDAGETDFLLADTDGDGVDDGLEDVNRNGRVDEGETNPLSRDTDGDGIYDGADPTPLPQLGAPLIVSLRPDSGPAEGGTFIELTGRNFAADARVWFGSHRAADPQRVDTTSILVAAPPTPATVEPGPVNIRVVNPGTRLSGRLQDGFRYTPKSRLAMALESLNVVERIYRGYEGAVRLSLKTSGVVDTAEVVLHFDPPQALQSVRLVPEPALRRAHRAVSLRPIGPGQYRFRLGPGRSLGRNTALASIHWAAGFEPGVERRLNVSVHGAWARVVRGGVIDIEARPLTIAITGPVPRAGPIPGQF